MTQGPPRRPPVSITPPARPVPVAVRFGWLVAACWIASLVLVVVAALDVVLHWTEVQRRLALIAVGDHPGTPLGEATDAARIALLVFAALALVTVASAAVGLFRLLTRRDAWRGWLLASTAASIAFAADVALTFSSTSELQSTGVTTYFVWAALPAAIISTVGSALAYAPGARR